MGRQRSCRKQRRSGGLCSCDASVPMPRTLAAGDGSRGSVDKTSQDRSVDPNRRRGQTQQNSSQLALQIAADPAKKELALKQFGSLTLALTTQNTKESLFALWEKICRRLGVEALPVMG